MTSTRTEDKLQAEGQLDLLDPSVNSCSRSSSIECASLPSGTSSPSSTSSSGYLPSNLKRQCGQHPIGMRQSPRELSEINILDHGIRAGNAVDNPDNERNLAKIKDATSSTASERFCRLGGRPQSLWNRQDLKRKSESRRKLAMRSRWATKAVNSSMERTKLLDDERRTQPKRGILSTNRMERATKLSDQEWLVRRHTCGLSADAETSS